MTDLFDKLIRILRAEEETDYDNTTVIGGLEGFLSFWSSEARPKASTAEERRRLSDILDWLGDYNRLSPAQRGQRVSRVLARLGVGPAAPPATPPPRPPSSTPTPKARPPQRRPAPPAADAPQPTAPEAAAPQRPPRPDVGDRPALDHRMAVPSTLDQQRASREAQRQDADLDAPLTELKGVGKSTAEKLSRLGLQSVRDVLYYTPFRYEDYTEMKPLAELRYGDEVTVAGVVQKIDMYKSKRGTIVINALIGDGTGTVRARWYGNRWLPQQLPAGTMVQLSGRVDAYMGQLLISSPRYELIDESELKRGWLVPIYSRTEGVSEKLIHNVVASALEHTAGKIPDPLPDALRKENGLVDLGTAIRWIHQPDSREKAEAARRRLSFDELLRLQLGMLNKRREWKNQPGLTLAFDRELLVRFVRTLPYELTEAQKRALNGILRDMRSPSAMSRLLQGDVGSGKTVVAAAALLAAVSAGYQAALMAPTEILAEQHATSLQTMLADGESLLGRPLRIGLLTGSLSAGDKAALQEQIRSHEVDIVVGTHALIQDRVSFANLGLAIVDEQHRFGVEQRGALRRSQDDAQPDLLVMSATPIPRSLALTLYGDLDLSIIDEMPPGRQPIITRAIQPWQRERAYTYIRGQLNEGRQAFIICPLVEESDQLASRAAVEEHRFLQDEVFPDFNVGLLHGRLSSAEKEAEMTRFYHNDSQLLVSTSVVEVGIDVPNASVMLVEGANRFGLAQLHQFRGRIGRGPWRSLCLLMQEENISSDGEERLNALVENSDGFALAEQDLQMRGPGDFFGTRQSGLPDLTVARLGDSVTLVRAREAAQILLDADPELSHPANALLREQTQRYWSAQQGELS
ncbi:MAG: ATP-dependent DNA helicase RecG [Ardenticatenales bacterium]|nr:ATP-dependent DNA helicase RecG [Ardenticatenales bacterium]